MEDYTNLKVNGGMVNITIADGTVPVFRERGDFMIVRLPDYYRKSKVVKDLYAVIQKLLDKVAEDISAEDLRLFITTTDNFSLHEKDVVLPEISADNQTKRARGDCAITGK